MSKAYGYIRVSTREQVNNGTSLDTQKDQIKAYCNSKQIDLIDILVDEGVSGSLELSAREGLQTAINSAILSEAEYIVVQAFDRYARNTMEHLIIEQLLNKNNIKLLSIREEALCEDNPENKMMRGILALFNEYERTLINTRCQTGIKKIAKSGVKPTGAVALGYERSKDKKNIHINTSEAYIVKEIFSDFASMKASGVSPTGRKLYNDYNMVQEITNSLYKKGYRNRKGSPINESAVRVILKNPFYIGLLRYGDIVTVGTHKPIIDIELWKQAGNPVPEVIPVS